MSLAERLRRAYLRWSRLGVAGLLLLPIIATSLLGFLWLHERGLLLIFVLVFLRWCRCGCREERVENHGQPKWGALCPA